MGVPRRLVTRQQQNLPGRLLFGNLWGRAGGVVDRKNARRKAGKSFIIRTFGHLGPHRHTVFDYSGKKIFIYDLMSGRKKNGVWRWYWGLAAKREMENGKGIRNVQFRLSPFARSTNADEGISTLHIKKLREKKLKTASTPSCFKVTQTGQFLSGQFLWGVSYVPRQLKRASGGRYWRSTEESSEKEARWRVVAGTEEESKKRSKKRQRNILEVPASHKQEPGPVRRRAPPPGWGPAARPGRPLRGPTRAPAGDRPSAGGVVQYVGGWLSGGW